MVPEPESGSPTEPRYFPPLSPLLFLLLTVYDRRRREDEASQSGSSAPNSPIQRGSIRPHKPLPVPPTPLESGSGSEPPSAENTPISPRRKRPTTPDVITFFYSSIHLSCNLSPLFSLFSPFNTWSTGAASQCTQCVTATWATAFNKQREQAKGVSRERERNRGTWWRE